MGDVTEPLHLRMGRRLDVAIRVRRSERHTHLFLGPLDEGKMSINAKKSITESDWTHNEKKGVG